MKNKFTLIKVGKDNYRATPQDLEFLSNIFDKRSFSTKEIDDYGIVIEEMEFSDDSMILVKIGKEGYNPTLTDLDAWRQVFEEAQNDKDFKIFTHDKIAIEKIKKDKMDKNCFKIINSFDELQLDDIKNIQPIKSELNNRFWWRFPPTIVPGIIVKNKSCGFLMHVDSLAGDVEKWPESVLHLRPYVECKQRQEYLNQAYQRNGYVESFQIKWIDFINEWEVHYKSDFDISQGVH